MKSKQALAAFLFSLVATSAALADTHLIVWQSTPVAPRVILPSLDGETPAQAVLRYKNNLNNSMGLASLLPESIQLEEGTALELTAENNSGRPRLAFVANLYLDMTPEGARIQRNLRSFSKAGADTYVIALSADLGLSDQQAKEYRDQVADNFSLLVSLGGEDIAPELFGEEKTFANETNITRDRSELSLVQNFKKQARGIFFGICRGHQMGAIADGHTLYQDLTATSAGSTDYHVNREGTNSSTQQRWHEIQIQDSLLARFLRGTYQLRVNSVHHQAVNPKDSADSFVVALDDHDGIVESLQGKNGKSLSMQFHPEFPPEISQDENFSAEGYRIIQGVVRYARWQRQRNARSCSRIFL